MFTILGGFLMGLANSVPGVSGGTIAFIMGFYEELLDSLVLLVKGTKEQRIKSIKFILKVMIPCAVGLLFAIEILVRVFDSHIYAISSLFVGFILGALPVIIRDEKDCLKGKWLNIIYAIIGAAVVILITYLNSVISPDDGSFKLTFFSAIYLFICGAIAISGMILPGISGSTLLLIFGLYMTVINAVHEVLHLNFSALPICLIFGCGVLVGIVGIVGLLKKCLAKFRSQTVYLILGLMIGSFYSIFMGPTTLDVPQPAMTFKTFNWVFFIIGIAVIAAIEVLKHMVDKKEEGQTE